MSAIRLTRRGFLAAQLLRDHPDGDADYSEIEEAVVFPDGGR